MRIVLHFVPETNTPCWGDILAHITTLLLTHFAARCPCRHRIEFSGSPSGASGWTGNDPVVSPKFTQGHVAVVRLLLEHGADVATVSESGLTPLHIACEYGAAGQIRVLLNAGAPRDRLSNATWSGGEHAGIPRGLPFMHALRNNELAAARQTVPNGEVLETDGAPDAAGLLHIGWTGLTDAQYEEAFSWIADTLLPAIIHAELSDGPAVREGAGLAGCSTRTGPGPRPRGLTRTVSPRTRCRACGFSLQHASPALYAC